jgi:predicted DNA-binding transcriptional regulator YafY
MWARQRLRAGKPVRATDLAREFKVAVRTAAYRDFEFLRDDRRVPSSTTITRARTP